MIIMYSIELFHPFVDLDECLTERGGPVSPSDCAISRRWFAGVEQSMDTRAKQIQMPSPSLLSLLATRGRYVEEALAAEPSEVDKQTNASGLEWLSGF